METNHRYQPRSPHGRDKRASLTAADLEVDRFPYYSLTRLRDTTLIGPKRSWYLTMAKV